MKKQVSLFTSALISLLTLSPQILAAEADWPMFQYSPQRQGASQRPAIKNPRILWKAPIGTAGWLNNPVIANQTVYVGSGGYLWNLPDHDTYQGQEVTDGVYAFDLNTGKPKWVTPALNDVNNVVYADNKIIATGAEAAIWAMDASTGKILWHTPLQGEGFQLLVLDQEVIVGDGKGQLLWLDIKTGKINKRSQLDSAIRAGASSDGETVFAATIEGSIYAFDRKGNLKWQQSLRTFYPELNDPTYPVRLEIYGAPTIYKDSLIIGFARDTVYENPALVALESKSGKLRWKGAAGKDKDSWGNIRTSPAIYQNYLLYAEPYSNTVIAIDAQTGKSLGVQNVGAIMFPQWSSPALAQDTLYIPRFDGGLYALSAANGKPIWQLYIGNGDLAGTELPSGLTTEYGAWKPPVGDAIYASPAIANDGRVLLPAAGYLYCIGEAP